MMFVMGFLNGGTDINSGKQRKDVGLKECDQQLEACHEYRE